MRVVIFYYRLVGRFMRRELAIALLCLTFVVAVGGLACIWSPHQINPDATAYFTIAEKYAQLDIRGAINGYWGPLLSWLLVPFVWLGVGLDAAARAISILAATATLALLFAFWRGRGLSRTAAVSVCLVLAAIFASWALLGPTSPDMLFAFLVALFAVRLDRFMVTMQGAVGLGCIGAALYFTKGFGLYLFLAAVGGAALWRWWRAGRTAASLRRFLPVFMSFAVLVLPFLVVLSLKYHQPTINTTGSYVHRAFGPEVQGSHLMLSRGPLSPPNATATTIWEDPSLLLPLMPDWSPLESKENFNYFLHKIVWHNLEVTLAAINEMGAMVAAAVLLLIVGCLNRGPGRTFRREYALLAAFGFAMIVGYALVLTEARYLWPVIVLAMMGLGLWVARLEQRRVFSSAQIMLAGMIIALLYVLPLPTKLQDAHLSATELYTQATQGLRPYLSPGTKVIADNFIEYNACYYLRLHCYAVLRTPAPDEAAAYYQQLKSAGVTYFMDYHSRDTDPGLQAFIKEYFVKTNDVSTPHAHPLTPLNITLYRLR